LTGYERVTATSVSNSTDKSISIDCSTGKKLLGGGGITSNAEIYLYASYPIDDDTWTVSAGEDGNVNSNWTVTVWAICATI
jgi:hypothetical protein